MSHYRAIWRVRSEVREIPDIYTQIIVRSAPDRNGYIDATIMAVGNGHPLFSRGRVAVDELVEIE